MHPFSTQAIMTYDYSDEGDTQNIALLQPASSYLLLAPSPKVSAPVLSLLPLSSVPSRIYILGTDN